MNDYQLKQDDKRERYLDLADEAEQRAERRAAGSLALCREGQPVLTGHHSERRHRRDLDRADSAMQKAEAEREKAEHYRQKALSVGRGGVSSDDPNAIEKLEAKLVELELKQQQMKRRNVSHRNSGGAPDERPHETWELSNNRANIRRYKLRLEELRANARRAPQAGIEGDGWRIFESRLENRIIIEFTDEPPRERWLMLRSFGWKRRRDGVTYSRHLNASGWCSAALIARKLAGGYAAGA